MKKCKTPSYIAEYELKPAKTGGFAVLHHAENAAVSVYNLCLKEGLKRMHKVINDPEYTALCREYKYRRKRTEKIDDCRKQFAALYDRHSYSEYSMHAYVASLHPKYCTLGIDECQKLATRAFRAVEKVRTHQAGKVRFLSHAKGTSFEGKSYKSVLHFNRSKMVVCLGRGNEYEIIIPRDDQYRMQCLKDRVKYVRILKRIIRGKERWYAQLVMEGTPPMKNLKFGEGTQGLDEGTSTIASVTDDSALLVELAPECKPNEAKMKRMQRAMDRSRRAMNPENYNPCGTIKKGRHEWKASRRYRKLKQKYAELRRKQQVYRKQSHCILAKLLIARGSDIRVERMSVKGLARRSKKQTTNSKNGRIRSKKRYWKTIQRRAPALLISLIDQKLHQTGKSILYVDTWKVKASQYNPLDETYKQKDLKDRMILLGKDASGQDIIVQRDLLSAYLIQHTNADGMHINEKSAYDDFQNFKSHQDAEVARLHKTGQLSWYIN